jgi:hypothetical protein
MEISMNNLKFIISFLTLIFLFFNCAENNSSDRIEIELVENKTEKKVDIYAGENLFTSYLYTDDISNLKKPVLFPINSASGVAITRGYPLEPRPNERTDHPHHIGSWLNYGEVNGLDYWGYSDETPIENKDRMGVIRHDKIVKIGKNELEVSANWLSPDGETLLKEQTKFIFYADNGARIIDRTTSLTANNEPVLFNDTKEGMFAIRVARQLEHPSDRPVTLSDAHGQKTDVPVLDNTGVTGKYLSSEGIEGTDVWGKRAKWVSLSGVIEGKDITVAIFDNPQNIGHPTYWHARGYGLFAANPLGQRTFSDGKEELNFSLQPGEKVTFKYRILVQDGKLNMAELETEYNNYIKK